MPYRLALTIAGAVSLGAFEGGVMFEIVDALRQHNNSVPDDQKIWIDVLTGASAGGMTAAIAAQKLMYEADSFAGPYDNPFYEAWVANVDIKGLLPLQKSESANQSVLSSDFVRSIAQDLLLARYQQAPLPAQKTHPAIDPVKGIKLGLALSNLNGVNYARTVLSGSSFNYTLFQDEIHFFPDHGTDTRAFWTPIADAALACGAFPFAFRPCDLTRNIDDYKKDYLVPFPSPRNFLYTDGGVFQNEPLGMAKQFVDLIDGHQNAETRAYFFVAPLPMDPRSGSLTAAKADFSPMATALVNAVINQAEFQDWIDTEDVNDQIKLFNLRAAELHRLLATHALQGSELRPVAQTLLSAFKLTLAGLGDARAQLRKQFADEYSQLPPPDADAWIDALLVFELAADLHLKDEMYIYQVTAQPCDLAGRGFFSFFGFLYRDFRDHDYDLGRQEAQKLLMSLSTGSNGFPKIRYTPSPIRPIQPTPPGGFTATMIPEQNRKELRDSLVAAADNFLKEIGEGSIVRWAINQFFVKPKINDALGL